MLFDCGAIKSNKCAIKWLPCTQLCMYYVSCTQIAPRARQNPCTPNESVSPTIQATFKMNLAGLWVKKNPPVRGRVESGNIKALRHRLFVHFFPAAALSTESGPFVDSEYSQKHYRTTFCWLKASSTLWILDQKSQRKSAEKSEDGGRFEIIFSLEQKFCRDPDWVQYFLFK